MNNSVAPATTPALRPAGRERTCEQCGTTYRSPRSTSRYCSDRCRKQAQRGAPEDFYENRQLDLLRRWLFRRSYAGQIGPVNRRDPRPPVYGLTVSESRARDEWNAWHVGASMTPDEFTRSLAKLKLYRVHQEPPKGHRKAS